ncbi:MAG: beta-CASP ribonuclease aCPSF1, partial [Thermoproteota archaeon]|nr:beta-CASP ribonuclease aCPSF1 [Thermoproteota archaeon]
MTHEKIEKITLRERAIPLKDSNSVTKCDKSSLLSATLKFEEKLESQVMQSIPKEAQITIVRCEAANIALYTKDPSFALTELTLHLSALSKSMKKRFIIRTDPSIRLSEDDARNAINKIL